MKHLELIKEVGILWTLSVLDFDGRYLGLNLMRKEWMEDGQMVFFLSLVVLPRFFEMKTYFSFTKNFRSFFRRYRVFWMHAISHTHVDPLGKWDELTSWSNSGKTMLDWHKYDAIGMIKKLQYGELQRTKISHKPR